jgi:hypothetical protein
MKWFFRFNLSSCGRRVKHAGCGQVRRRNICFGHVPLRDAAAAGEEQLGRCAAGKSKYYRLYLYSGKLTSAVMCLRRVRVAGRSFAVALAPVSRIGSPPAPAAKNLGVGLRRPCRGGDVWRHACCPCAARCAAFNEKILPWQYSYGLRISGEETTLHHAARTTHIKKYVSLAQA